MGLIKALWGGHAERCALTAAQVHGLQLPVPDDVVLFVELAPCPSCATWLAGSGGGVPNPFDFGPGGITLNVWYAFPYNDVGVKSMTDFHTKPVDHQDREAAAW